MSAFSGPPETGTAMYSRMNADLGLTYTYVDKLLKPYIITAIEARRSMFNNGSSGHYIEAISMISTSASSFSVLKLTQVFL